MSVKDYSLIIKTTSILEEKNMFYENLSEKILAHNCWLALDEF